MHHEELTYVVQTQLQKSERVLTDKNKSYSDASDALHAFKLASKINHTNLKKALGGMMSKHTVSIYDMIADEGTLYSVDEWDEKITDHINYLILLRAIVQEELHGQVSLFDDIPYEDSLTYAELPKS